jgi:hypothetical protein
VSHGGAVGRADAGVAAVVVVVEELASEGAFVVGAVVVDRGVLSARGVDEEQPASTPEITRAGTIDHCLRTVLRSSPLATSPV